MDDGGELGRASAPAAVTNLAPDRALDPAASVRTARMAVASSRLIVARTEVTMAESHRVLAASNLILAKSRRLVADLLPSRDTGRPTPLTEKRYEQTCVGPAQKCAATIRWVDALDALAPLRADGDAGDDRSAMNFTETTGAGQSPSVWRPMLSSRERQVLGYAPSMLSAAEIGSELFVSVNTVKAHLRSIYRKLGVSRRRDAVIQARRRGLL